MEPRINVAHYWNTGTWHELQHEHKRGARVHHLTIVDVREIPSAAGRLLKILQRGIKEHHQMERHQQVDRHPVRHAGK